MYYRVGFNEVVYALKSNVRLRPFNVCTQTYNSLVLTRYDDYQQCYIFIMRTSDKCYRLLISGCFSNRKNNPFDFYRSARSQTELIEYLVEFGNYR